MDSKEKFIWTTENTETETGPGKQTAKKPEQKKTKKPAQKSGKKSDPDTVFKWAELDDAPLEVPAKPAPAAKPAKSRKEEPAEKDFWSETRRKKELAAKLEKEAKARERHEKLAEVLKRREERAEARREQAEKARLEKEERARLEAEAKEEARRQREARARLEAEAKEKARLEKEERARLEAEAREEARRQREEQARLEAEAKEEARRQKAEQEKLEREERARLEAEEREERARLEEEARIQRAADLEAKKEADIKARREKEIDQILAKEERARAKREKEEKVRQELEEIERLEKIAYEKREAELKARREAAIKAKREKEISYIIFKEEKQKAKREKELAARLEREERAKLDADAKEEARLKREAEIEAKREAELATKREREISRVLAREEKAKARLERSEQARLAREARAEERRKKAEQARLEREARAEARQEKAEQAGLETPAKPETENAAKLRPEKTAKPPKQKKTKVRKKKSALAVTLYTLLGLFLAVIIAAAGYVGYVAHTTDNIDPENIYSQIDMTSFLYDSKGHEIDRIYYSEDREKISIDEIPEDTKEAFIAIEDKTFYEHHGFNFRRMIGAVINKILGRSEEISGTSTITQQLARNVYLADVKSQRTIRRKLSEMLYAWKIERTLSKDEILEAYLNTIYLGYGNYGIEAAARSYFDKDVRELTLAESAALAALPQAPDSYALLKDEEEEGTTYLKKYDVYANDMSKDRRNLVLSLMQEQGYITAAEAAEADVEIEDILKPHREKKTNEFTYFSDYVVNKVADDLAAKYNMTAEEAQRLVYTGGLRIETTVDSEIQKIINKEFADDYNFPWSSEEPEAAMVVADVETGRVLAMVGGRQTKGKKLFNRATSPRQPGSSIKPLSVYSAALQKSYDYAKEGKVFPYTDYGYDRQGVYYWGDYITASSYVADEKMTVNGEEWPQNFSRSYSGRQTFRSALQQSINTCAVKIMLQVGADYSMEVLKNFGISTAVDDASLEVNDLNSAALGLGAMAYGVTPLDMAEAYAAFPNGGVRNDPVCYTEVKDANGKVLLTGQSVPERVLDEGVAFIMTDCLKSVVYAGIARSASIYGVQVGGKTGTTNDTADIWFCGFTPKYSAALWIGTDHNSEMNTTSNTAAALWSRIMSQVPGVTEGEYRSMPEDVVYQYGEYYTEGTVPAYVYYGKRRRN